MSATVPDGLSELLEEFAVTVLREKPADLLQFAAQYFNDLWASKQKDGQPAMDHVAGSEPATMAEVEMTVEPASDDEDDDLAPPPSYRAGMDRRRRSVFAESYEPGEDDQAAEKVVHSKSDEQRQRLGEAVSNIFLFRSLDNEQMVEVLDAMFEKKVVAGERLIEQGDDGDNFYVIDSGRYEVFVSKDGGESKCVLTYSNEGFFGELALMYNTPRAATVVATSEGILWALDRITFKRIICGSASRKRQMYQSFLESVPMLKTLEPYELMNLADAFERKYYSDGDCVIKQGDAADAFYIVEDGEVKITKENPNNPGSSVELSTCSRGQYFGELALIANKPRAASGFAVGDVTCAVLDVGAFERLLGPCMEVMKRNFSHYEEQLMQLFGTTLDITDTR